MPKSLAALSGSLGLAIIFLNVFVEQLGLPVPAVPILLLAGAVARSQTFWGVEVLVLSTVACVLTDVGWYLAGRRYGYRLMRFLCRVSLSPDSCVSQTQLRFERWGVKALLLAKFVPGLTVIAMPLAGAQRMSWPLFLWLSLLGSVLWIAAPLLIGALAAAQISALVSMLTALGTRFLVLLLLLLASYIALKWWQRRRFYAQLRMARVEPPELHTLLQREPPPIILDVRTHSARALDPRSIPCAVHLPPEDVATKLSGFALGQEVIAYCTCPNEASAARVAKLLMQHGVLRVRPLRGGLEAWVAAGYPVSSVMVAGEVAAAGHQAAMLSQ